LIRICLLVYFFHLRSIWSRIKLNVQVCPYPALRFLIFIDFVRPPSEYRRDCSAISKRSGISLLSIIQLFYFHKCLISQHFHSPGFLPMVVIFSSHFYQMSRTSFATCSLIRLIEKHLRNREASCFWISCIAVCVIFFCNWLATIF